MKAGFPAPPTLDLNKQGPGAERKRGPRTGGYNAYKMLKPAGFGSLCASVCVHMTAHMGVVPEVTLRYCSLGTIYFMFETG